MKRIHLERALFIIGNPDAGKSTQIRNMLQDVRFHRDGDVPSGTAARRLPETIRISNERVLYMRLTSPHEMNETLKEFLDKTKQRIEAARQLGLRWNVVCPLQPKKENRMPRASITILSFMRRFGPERTRAIFLSPDRHGTSQDQSWLTRETDLLWSNKVEICCADARSRTANGLMFADFFDFT